MSSSLTDVREVLCSRGPGCLLFSCHGDICVFLPPYQGTDGSGFEHREAIWLQMQGGDSR